MLNAGIVDRLVEAGWRQLRRARTHPLSSDAVSLLGAQLVASAIGLLTTAVVARRLGPRDFGTVSVIATFPALLFAVVSFKPMTVTTRYLSAFRTEGRTEDIAGVCKLGLLLDTLPALLALAVVAVAADEVGERVYRLSGTGSLQIAYAASFPFSALTGTSFAALTAVRRFRTLSALHVLEKTLIMLLTVAALWSGTGVPGVIAATALGSSIAGLGSLATAMHALGREGVPPWWSVPLGRVRSVRKEIMASFGWNYLTMTLSGATAQLPVMLLARTSGAVEAGFYRLAGNLASVASYVETSMAKVAYPELTTRGREGPLELVATLRRWTLRAGIWAGAAIVLTFPILPWAIPAIFGPEFDAMVGGAVLLLLGVAVNAVFFWAVPALYASGHFAAVTKIFAAYTLLSLAAGAWAASRWGFVGMAAALGAGRAVYTLALVALRFRMRS